MTYRFAIVIFAYLSRTGDIYRQQNLHIALGTEHIVLPSALNPMPVGGRRPLKTKQVKFNANYCGRCQRKARQKGKIKLFEETFVVIMLGYTKRTPRAIDIIIIIITIVIVIVIASRLSRVQARRLRRRVVL